MTLKIILGSMLIFSLISPSAYAKKPRPKKEEKIVTVFEREDQPEEQIITQQEAQTILQIASCFLCIVQQPNNKQAIVQSIGGMAAGMASLIVHGMSRGKRCYNEKEYDQLKKEITTYIYKYLINELHERNVEA